MRCEREENGGVTRWRDRRGWNIFTVAGAGCEEGLSVGRGANKTGTMSTETKEKKKNGGMENSESEGQICKGIVKGGSQDGV